jgi:hypothetical protein
MITLNASIIVDATSEIKAIIGLTSNTENSNEEATENVENDEYFAHIVAEGEDIKIIDDIETFCKIAKLTYKRPYEDMIYIIDISYEPAYFLSDFNRYIDIERFIDGFKMKSKNKYKKLVNLFNRNEVKWVNKNDNFNAENFYDIANFDPIIK